MGTSLEGIVRFTTLDPVGLQFFGTVKPCPTPNRLTYKQHIVYDLILYNLFNLKKN